MKRKFDAENALNIEEKLSCEECRARLAIIDKMIDNGGVVGLDEVESIPSDMMKSLAEKKVISVCEGKVIYAYPVSGLKTMHNVKLHKGDSFYAMCAVDSLGAAFTLGKDVTIDSRCAVCGEPIHIEIRDGKLKSYSPEGLCVTHMDLRSSSDWALTC